eukprot:TRINITY_DN4813_c0_g1_i2.p1 TRINITY_DN4813_c0_g1~~TRINITY_DN4813_c0_g1_i2.p1  ORF type:complete len:159 (-),score=19.90 TRINITY_DN4813_c0_g1_i2:77-553(-)
MKSILFVCLVGFTISVPVAEKEDERFFGIIGNLFKTTTTPAPSDTTTEKPKIVENIFNWFFPTTPMTTTPAATTPTSATETETTTPPNIVDNIIHFFFPTTTEATSTTTGAETTSSEIRKYFEPSRRNYNKFSNISCSTKYHNWSGNNFIRNTKVLRA